MEDAKEYKALQLTWCTKPFAALLSGAPFYLMLKLVPLYSDCIPMKQQDILQHTITKHAQCLAVFEHLSNPHINLWMNSVLSNHSLCLIALSYQINKKAKTFLSLDYNHHSIVQVIFTYPHKYWGVANSHAHHLVKYMEYENGPPAAGSIMLAWQLLLRWNKIRRRNVQSPNLS